MKALACEMCGSNDVVKQEGLYVCQHCGTKYTLEEARKLMIEGTVDVSGSTVKIDSTNELNNLYELARRAKSDNNTENAAKYYDMILLKDPYSWEATFYQVYYNSMNCRICDIEYAAKNVENNISSVLTLITAYVQDENEQAMAIYEVVDRCKHIANMLFTAAKNTYDEIGDEIRYEYTQEMINRCCRARDLLYTLGDTVNVLFKDNKEIQAFCAEAWINAVAMHNELITYFENKKANQEIIDSYVEKIKKVDSSYEKPTPKSSGCYIATCVYGSYDCPEVWVLRRFRDNVLAENIIGRLFIKFYYAVSPRLVNKFGQNNLVRNIWQKPLDILVSLLCTRGFKDTPYND